MQTNQPSDPAAQATLVATTYAYDPAGHLTSIDTGSEATLVHFGIDALGRHAGQSIGPVGDETAVTTYAYLGTSDTVSSSRKVEDRDPDPDEVTLTYSAIDAIGNRLTTGSAEAFAYLLPDLHGNVVATMTSGSTPAFSAAYRYDAYGVTCDSYAPSGSIASPWRYQGRILESADGTADLYDFTARSYDPGLGAFTSFDSVTGSAQNPLTLNRYLYANANPATMIDPDGHVAVLALAMACTASAVCVTAVSAVAIQVWAVVTFKPEWVASLAGKVDDVGRAAVGVGDWGLQKATQGIEAAFSGGPGLHDKLAAALAVEATREAGQVGQQASSLLNEVLRAGGRPQNDPKVQREMKNPPNLGQVVCQGIPALCAGDSNNPQGGAMKGPGPLIVGGLILTAIAVWGAISGAHDNLGDLIMPKSTGTAGPTSRPSPSPTLSPTVPKTPHPIRPITSPTSWPQGQHVPPLRRLGVYAI